MATPAQGLRLPHGEPRKGSAQGAGDPVRPRFFALRHPPHFCARRRRRKIPISLLYRKDTPLDGTAPLLLYGYGAYGIAIPAAFSVARLSWSTALRLRHRHIRGGKDKGYGWYEAGKRGHKANTLRFHRRGGAPHRRELYVARKDRRRGRLGGGMLMGPSPICPRTVRRNRRRGAFVDVLNTMLDATLPLTPPEWPEWGNPVERARITARPCLSPYDNVAAQEYPPILVLAGLDRSARHLLGAGQRVARLARAEDGRNPLYLRTTWMRPRRRRRPFRRTEGEGDRARLRAEGHRQGRGAAASSVLSCPAFGRAPPFRPPHRPVRARGSSSPESACSRQSAFREYRGIVYMLSASTLFIFTTPL